MKHVIQSTYDQSVAYGEPTVVKRISWGAIFAGVTAAVIVQLLLTLLGVGIGAATVNPLQEQAPGQGLGIGAAIWFFVSSIIAMYVGGLVAGRFSNAALKRDRMSHGVFTWAATTLLSAIFLASAISSLLGNAAGSAAGSAVQAKSAQPGNAQPAVSAAPDTRNPAASGMNEQEAREAADTAAKRVSQTALGTFFLLALSGIAAAMGGRNSVRRPALEDDRMESEHHATPALAKS